MIFFQNSMSSSVIEKIFLTRITVVAGAGDTRVKKSWSSPFEDILSTSQRLPREAVTVLCA